MDVESCPIFARVASVLVKQVRSPFLIFTILSLLSIHHVMLNVSPRLFNKHQDIKKIKKYV